MDSLIQDVEFLKRRMLQKRSPSVDTSGGIKLRCSRQRIALNESPRSVSLNNIDFSALMNCRQAFDASPPQSPTSSDSLSPDLERRQLSFDEQALWHVATSVYRSEFAPSADGDSNSSTIFALPDSLVLNILRRMGCTDLLRFGCASKQCASFIQDRSLCCSKCSSNTLLLLPGTKSDTLNRILCTCQAFDTRSAVVAKLGERMNDERVLPIILNCLTHDPDHSIRCLCITILSSKYSDNPTAVETLEKIASGDPDTNCRTQAITCVRYLSQLRQESQRNGEGEAASIDGDAESAAVPSLLLDDKTSKEAGSGLADTVVLPIPVVSILD